MCKGGERLNEHMNDTAEYVGLDGIGPYTMRKTFGYWNYKKLY